MSSLACVSDLTKDSSEELSIARKALFLKTASPRNLFHHGEQSSIIKGVAIDFVLALQQ